LDTSRSRYFDVEEEEEAIDADGSSAVLRAQYEFDLLPSTVQ